MDPIRARFLRLTALLAMLAVAAGVAAEDNPPGGKPTIPRAAIQEFTDVFERTRADAAMPIDGDALMVAATKGMLERIDPEGGAYYTRQEYEDFKNGLDRQQAGLGLEIRVRKTMLVVFPIAGGPAALAGIRDGDWLRTVDGVPVAGLRPDQASALMRGAAGTHVALAVARGESGSLLRVDLERRAVSYPPVSLSRSDDDLAILQVPPFYSRSLHDQCVTLTNEWSRRPFKGIVLDLRHNIGGLLETSIGLAAMFLKPDELVVTTAGRIAQANQAWHATPADYLRHGEVDPLPALPAAIRALPLVVLVDGSTASGAELSAAALRDHGRAIIVGHVTYGRGSVQTIMPMHSGGAMKITTAYYITPSGLQLQGQGLQPDVLVDSDDEAVALQAALAALRKRL